MKIKRLILIVIIYGFVSLSIMGCASSPPPLELTPQADVIEKALQIQLDKKYQQISEQLHTEKAKFKITQINVNQIQPTVKFQLPTYHLEGNYQIIIKQRKSGQKKITNQFQLDLQRQSAGKTWRIIIPYREHQTTKYYSYKI